MNLYKLAFLSLPIAVAVACSNNPPPANPSGVANVQRVDGKSAADEISQARCRHALACNEIGNDRTYPTMNVCEAKNRGDLQNDLQGSSCKAGVDPTRLEACVSALKAEACSGLGSGISRDAACRTGELCPE